MKISTIYFKDENQYNAINEIAHRERKSISEIARVALDDYIKVHGNGNPNYELDNWCANPKFIAVPAMLAQHSFIKEWLTKADSKIISEVRFKLQEWQHLLKQWEYGKL